jgi:hydroxyacylglutathione hydrolase
VTGDFLFVGDVGRPDLLERAAGYAGSMESAARTLHASLRAFREQPDHLQIWPGHGAGSACGKSLGAMPHSTLGFEKMFNWALQPRDEEDFVQEILTGQPAPPRYFARMKVLNRDEQFLDPLPATPRPLEPSALPEALRKNAQVVDLRPASQHATRHVRGTLSIPMNKSFANWAGALLNYDEPVYLLAEDATGKPVADATRAMGLIGMDSVAGVFDPRALDAAERAGLPAAQSAEVSTSEVRKALDSGFTVIDVRNANEWIEGHIPGAIHIPLAALPAKLSVIPDGPVVVHCQSGGRAWIAASVLERAGLEDVHAYSDGFAGWKREGQPVEREDEALSASSAQKK